MTDFICAKVLSDQCSSIRPLGPGLGTLNCSSSCQVSAAWFRCFTAAVKRKRKQLPSKAPVNDEKQEATAHHVAACSSVRSGWNCWASRTKNDTEGFSVFMLYFHLALARVSKAMAAAHDLSRLLDRWKTEAAATVFSHFAVILQTLSLGS